MLINPEQLMRQAQLAVFNTLSADGGFDDVALIDLRPGDITSIVESALGALYQSKSGKSGLTMLVWPPEVSSMEGTGGGVGQPVMEIKMELISKDFINFSEAGANLESSAIAWRAFVLLKNRAFGWLGIRLLTTDKPIMMQQDEQAGDARYSVLLKFYAPPADELRVATPVPVPGGNGEFSLTCATAGTTMYYTTAALGVLPAYPSAENGTLYDGAVTLTESATVLAAAYKAGVPSSEVLVFTVEPSEGNVLLREDDEPLLREDGENMLRED